MMAYSTTPCFAGRFPFSCCLRVSVGQSALLCAVREVLVRIVCRENTTVTSLSKA